MCEGDISDEEQGEIVLVKFNINDQGKVSILFYPITLEGCRGTTDEFATIPFHLDLFSAALVELAKSIPVHSLILSSHLFFCLPLFLFPFTVPLAGSSKVALILQSQFCLTGLPAPYTYIAW